MVYYILGVIGFQELPAVFPIRFTTGALNSEKSGMFINLLPLPFLIVRF